MFAAAALPAVATAAGAYLGYRGVQDTNKANAQMATTATEANERMFYDNMNNQNWMATHSYQNAIRDMKAAGVNPMLAYAQGGAPTGSGSSGSAVVGNPMQNPMSGMSTAIQNFLFNKANLDAIRAGIAKTKQDTDTSRQQGNMYGQQANLNMVNMNNAVTAGEILQGDVPGARVKGQIDSSSYAKALAIANRLGINVNSAVSLLSAFKPVRLPATSVTSYEKAGNSGYSTTTYHK